ncbi:MAG: DUF2125 domain-containing protein [Rhodospirillales bacterium]|jgi:hypothetical protein|nr:DUF2125 domain-containing protein [Rhodospirillales bacterium]
MRQPSHSSPGTAPDRHPALDYRPPRRLRAAKWAIGAAIGGIVLGALYMGFWNYAAELARDSVLDWMEARRQEGAVVGFERLNIGGFPSYLRLVIDRPAMSWPNADAPWGWETDQLTAEMRPWNFRQIVLLAPGRHAVSWTTGGIGRTAKGAVRDLRAKVDLDGGRPVAGHIDARAADFAGDGGLDRLTLERAAADFRCMPVVDADDRTPVADVRVTAHEIGLPSGWGLPLGAEVAAIRLDATVLGNLPFGPLVDLLGGWRDDGGTVEVRQLDLTYGPLALAANGTLALDEALQPIGAFTARIEGFFETVDALRTRGAIRSQDAVTAKMVLGILAKRNDAGRISLAVPLTLQDRRLYVGPVPLAEVPPIRWQGR